MQHLFASGPQLEGNFYYKREGEGRKREGVREAAEREGVGLRKSRRGSEGTLDI